MEGNDMNAKHHENCVGIASRTGGGRVFAVVLAMAAGTAFGAARTVEMTAYDASTHTATLTVGAGAGTAADVKYLFAAYDSADRGTNPANWLRWKYVRTVYASTSAESFDWTLPAEWQATSGKLRFFLAAPIGNRKQDGYYLATYGVGSGYNSPTNHPNGQSFLQWIDTGIKASSAVSITIDTSVYNTAGTAPFGEAYDFFVFAGANASNPTYYSFGHSGSVRQTEKYNPNADEVHQIRLGQEGLFIDGVCKDGPFTSTFTKQNNIWLFGRNRTDVNTTINETTTDKQVSDMVNNLKLGWCRIWSAQIYTNGVLARSFLPAQVNNENVMWDSVTGTAFHNAGGNHPFMYNKTTVSLSDGSVETTSAAHAISPSISVSRTDARTRSVTLAVGGQSVRCALYAVHGSEDLGAGSDPAAWDEMILVGAIPAGATTYTATLPEAWWKAGGFARFMVGGVDIYDWPLTSLSSTGKGDYLVSNNQNTGTNDQGYQYIDTGIRAKTNTTTTVRLNQPRYMNMAAFGHASRYYLFSNGATLWGAFSKLPEKDGNGNDQDNSFSATTSSYPALHAADGNDHTMQLGPDGAYVDDVNWWVTVKGTAPIATAWKGNEWMTMTATLTLFARRDWNGGIGKFGACTIYSATIKEGNTLVRDFIPVEKDGMGYMYDKVSKQLFGNANTTYGTAANGGTAVPFVKGDPIVSLSADGVLAVSGRVTLSNGTIILFK